MRKALSRIAFALAVLGLAGTPARAAEQVLRIAMTAADVPTTTGSPTQGLEGFRFAGYPVFESLVMWDLRRTDVPPPVIPWLATEWQSDPEDRRRWVFRLREGVTFHDGSPFDADAVVWNLARFFDEGAPQFERSAAASMRVRVSLMDRWAKVDSRTVAIWSREVATYFPEMLTGVMFASPAQWEKAGRDWNRFAAEPAGTGAFRIAKVTRSSIEMTKNAAYWNKERAAKLDRVVLLPMAEATTRLAALRSGQVDWIEVPPPDAIPGLKAAGFQVATSPFPHIWPYWLKTSADSVFKDRRVRQALNYAIDREGIATLLNGTAEPAAGFWKRGDPRFGEPKNSYRYDPAKAKALLAEAGFKPGELVKAKILISTSGSGQMLPLPMNELIQQGAKAAGFDLDFMVVEWGQMGVLARQRPDSPEMRDVVGVNSSLTTADMNWFFRSFFPPNWSKWENPEAVALMETYRTDFSTTDHTATLARLHALLVDEAPWAWIVHDRNPRAFSPKVRGYTPAQSWFNDLTTISMAP